MNLGFGLPAEPNEPRPDGILDGGMWPMEGRRGDRYQALRRWSPTDQPIRTLGVALVKLAGLPPLLDALPGNELPPIPPPTSWK